MAYPLRKQLESSERLGQTGLTHSASYRSLEAIGNSTESMEDFLEKVATDTQELMNKGISARQVRNG